jgi:hypothetical protein
MVLAVATLEPFFFSPAPNPTPGAKRGIVPLDVEIGEAALLALSR